MLGQVRERARNGEGGESDDSLQARYYARPVSYWLAVPLIRFGVTPNVVTVAALLACVVGGALFNIGHPFAAAVALNIGHLLDYVDGTIARATGKVTNFGWYFDRTCDEFVEVLIPIAIGVSLYRNGYSDVFLALGFGYAVVHCLSTISTLHSRLIYGVTPSSGNRRSILVSIGTNLKSCAVPSLLVLSLMPYGLALYLVGFGALAVCELVWNLRTAMVR